MGRRPNGSRLDLDPTSDPKHEPAEFGTGVAPNSHVRKAGPRGGHDDTQIFRRGLPYMETTPDGSLEVGLQFCSFQATLDQFDVVFSDWCLESNFPVEGAGRDALLNPDRELAQVLRVGFYFVPPHHDRGLAAAVFALDTPSRRPTKGRLVVHKRVRDQSDPNRRFERRGFVFQLRHQATDGTVGEAIGAPFITDSTGRAVFDGELTIGETYELHETHSPVPNVALAVHTFAMDKPNVRLPIENVVTVPNTPYGGTI